MTRVLFSPVIAVAIVLIVGSAKSSNAQGVHFGAGPVHVDVGYPHRSHFRPVYVPGYARYGYGGRGGYGAYQSQYRPASHGHVDWHATTHYDYHPGGFEPHYNHYDYAPSHFDAHPTGHWDAHH